tara:strand:+ start:261 stop:791 length:531 start_codon:yes stop_codon:yes gene_type:complete
MMSTVESLLARMKGSHNPCFYHFTDLQNLPSIREHGLLSLVKMEEMGLRPPKPGGTQLSRDLDAHYRLNRYVHLCFWNQHPMEYVQKQNGHIGETKFLEINPAILRTEGAIATKEVSIKTGAVPLPVEEMLPNLDLEVCYDKTDWKDKGVQARKQLAYKYELLIPDQVPLDMILNL